MLKSSQHSIVIGDRIVDLARELLRDERGDTVPLRPRAWLVLRLLATRAGRLVGKDEIMDEVWSDCEVTEDSLVQAIGDIRRALGDAGRSALKTLPRRGYMLVINGEPTDSPVVSSDATSRPSSIEDLAAPSSTAAFVHRCSTVRKHWWRSRAGLFRRWRDRKPDNGPVADRRLVRHRAATPRSASREKPSTSGRSAVT